MAKKLYIETVGCQMNVLDSELVVGSLRRQGYELTQEPTEADVILFNTCSVRQHAEDKIYSALGRLRYHKQRHPSKILGVLGCMAQKDQALVRRRAPHVDIVCGTGQLARLPELIAEVERTGKPQLALSLDRKAASRTEVEQSFESYDPLRDPSMRPSRFQAYVRIMIGCDKFCTYCIVPQVRGPEQSRRPDHIIWEVQQLAAEGCREVTLLGQTVNSYNYRLGDGRHTRLSDLLIRIHDTPGIDRIKFITSFPRDMSEDLLDAVRELPKVSPYLHVPVQSGCNEVLKRMKRLYTVEYYQEMLARCRERIPGVAISSDFIVGFCGETEASFARSCDLVATAGFKNSFIFKYSPRPGTKGHELFTDDVPEEVKKRRNNDLLAIQNGVSLADHLARIGTKVEVLVEGRSKTAFKHDSSTGPIQLTGRTPTDHIVVFEGNERLIGQFVTLAIREATAFTLFGDVVIEEQVGVEQNGSQRFPAAPLEISVPRVSLPLI
ncbi:MAG TPA: tRNA (N6-isopentenyl adenosine(37)-C2)-methylthiotransferase MiaB [Gemmataceae bacterium]|nr:tRNA (N6-isopentenyl adenosine(37)-C2)-methylthiotransferase MiaB [Gemmataceae bacterium]